MGNCKRAERKVCDYRLDILQYAGACCRISIVSYGHVAWKPSQSFFAKDVGDKSHGLFEKELPSVGRTDAGTFLSPVLKRVKTEIGKVCRLGMAEYPEYAAFFVDVVEHDVIILTYKVHKDRNAKEALLDLVFILMVETYMNEKRKLLSNLPSVDELLKSGKGAGWLKVYPRRYVRQAVRETIDLKRREIMDGLDVDLSDDVMSREIERIVGRLSSYSLKPLINATGVVIHTNLGRSILSERVLDNIRRVSGSYSNLEYDMEKGERGKRYAHIKRTLREITGAEDALVVNNNAAAVLLCLSTLSKDKEVIVSRGELVEIGGSFRIPDVMKSSGAVLREVGTTNKTHLYDYEKAINNDTSLILKVHKSNYRVIGFAGEVSIESLVKLGKDHDIPVMFDLGSGCLIDLKPFGIYDEPAVADIVKTGVDLTTFSGDKLLGGPQGGVIVGNKQLIEKIQKNPMTRAMRIDKLTLAGFEATLMEYIDAEKAIENIPTLRMLLQKPEDIKKRASRIAKRLKAEVSSAVVSLITDSSRAGGGALPEIALPTYVVAIKTDGLSVNEFEERLRKGNPPVIARIKEDSLILDARTIRDEDFWTIVERIKAALSSASEN
jgi:L-seryl-tRNA(Ser) seleniumtransferase